MTHWDAFALCLRGVLAVVWLYNGLWLKILAVDPHHAQIVASTLGHPAWLTAIGAGETLLALGILSGWLSRFVNGFQLFLLVAMNTAGILFSGQIANPVGLVISNLPLAACAASLIIFGPGRWILPSFKK
jgi:uncharacterized membrane protein YphA (DoxX/SURF4 family)